MLQRTQATLKSNKLQLQKPALCTAYECTLHRGAAKPLSAVCPFTGHPTETRS